MLARGILRYIYTIECVKHGVIYTLVMGGFERKESRSLRRSGNHKAFIRPHTLANIYVRKCNLTFCTPLICNHNDAGSCTLKGILNFARELHVLRIE